ncbi:hypothetical protein BN7_5468 [Wickerhamomyces ciferrii]|uniref:Uncharacterized protein n=1 Tax=Wickerhamomyces ciferrii (strain ATCC 14091 / BCRC 22168 / CBS 111 / JCM 3599 / NBRC 0793 / NRRL Y-1031 F-60-10) TaxID=1206466 RepID=K0KRW6_WICCF|nr:uncharacterized protein BN7_5468 [Wickerhamomyces ciferrii]CCH45881.1 hypothetical protein BN7_5468 [Wickerhamomyces ciferrii]
MNNKSTLIKSKRETIRILNNIESPTIDPLIKQKELQKNSPDKEFKSSSAPEKEYNLFKNYNINPLTFDGRYCKDLVQFTPNEKFLNIIADRNIPYEERLKELAFSPKTPMHIARFEITPKKHITDSGAYDKVQEIWIFRSLFYDFDDVIDRLRCFPNRYVNQSSIFDQDTKRQINLTNEEHFDPNNVESVTPPNFIFFNTKPGNFEFNDLVDFIELNQDDIIWRTCFYYCISPSLRIERFHFKDTDPQSDFLLVIDETRPDYRPYKFERLFNMSMIRTNVINHWNFMIGQDGDLEDF